MIYTTKTLLQDSTFTNPPVTESQIKLIPNVSNSYVGDPVTSKKIDESVIGVGTLGLNNIYQVISVGSTTADAFGVGEVTMTQITVAVDSNVNVSYGNSSYFGDFSWGRIVLDGTPFKK